MRSLCCKLLNALYMLTLMATLLLIGLPSVAAAGSDIAVSEDSGAEYKAGLASYKSAQYAAALKQFEQAYTLDERNHAALFAQGLALDKLKRYDDASSVLSGLLEKEPTHAKALLLHAVVLERAGKHSDAKAAYMRGLVVNSDDYRLHYGYARVCVALNENESALKSLAKAAELKAPDVNRQYLKAQILAKLGRDREAADLARVILKDRPGHVHAMILLADYLRMENSFEEALALYRKVSETLTTKAYADYYIDVIEQELEEREIEREYQERLKKEKNGQ